MNTETATEDRTEGLSKRVRVIHLARLPMGTPYTTAVRSLCGHYIGTTKAGLTLTTGEVWCERCEMLRGIL